MCLRSWAIGDDVITLLMKLVVCQTTLCSACEMLTLLCVPVWLFSVFVNISSCVTQCVVLVQIPVM